MTTPAHRAPAAAPVPADSRVLRPDEPAANSAPDTAPAKTSPARKTPPASPDADPVAAPSND